LRYLTYICCILLSLPTYALALEKPSSLYQIDIAVISPNPEGQQVLMREAFGKVVLRLAGTERVLSSQAFLEANQHIDSYVMQFAYFSPAPEQWRFQVRFHEALVNQLLKKAGAVVQSNKKPLILTVLRVEKGNEAYWLGEEGNDEVLLRPWYEASESRGFKIMVPLWDMRDLTSVSPQGFTMATETVVADLARRYQAKVVVAGHLKEKNGLWQAKIWTQGLSKTQHIDLEDTDHAHLIKTIFESLSRDLTYKDTAEASVKENQANELPVGIRGIRDFEHYAKLIDYFRHLKGVFLVRTVQLQGDALLLNLSIGISRESLQQQLQESPWLKFEPIRDTEGHIALLKYQAL